MFVGWSDRAAPTLEAAIPLRRYLEKHPEAFEALCARPSMRDRKRLLSAKKLDLVCVYACYPATTIAERKACSKFAKVVRAAIVADVPPEGAAAWLKKITLTDIVKQQANGKTPTKFAVRFSRSVYPLLAAAITEDATLSDQPKLTSILEEAAGECEQILVRSNATRP